MTPTKTTAFIDDAVQLEKFVWNASPGQTCVYHIGELARDRDLATARDREAAKEVNHVAGVAFALARKGLVHLLQHRGLDGIFRYLAVRSCRPAIAAVLR